MPTTNPKTQPLTVDTFNRHIMPQLVHIIGTTVENKLEEKLETKFESKLQPLREEIAKSSEAILELKVDALGEVQAMRDELQVALHHYTRLDTRMSVVEDRLGIVAG